MLRKNFPTSRRLRPPSRRPKIPQVSSIRSTILRTGYQLRPDVRHARRTASSPSGVAGLSDISVSFAFSGTHKSVFRVLEGLLQHGTPYDHQHDQSWARLAPIRTCLAVNDGQQYSMEVSAVAYTTYVAAA